MVFFNILNKAKATVGQARGTYANDAESSTERESVV